MVDVIDREIARWGREIDMAKEMAALTQRILLETLFGTSLDPGQTERLCEQILIALREMNLRLFLYFLPKRFPLPGDRAFRDAIATIDEAMLGLVRARRASGVERTDLLSEGRVLRRLRLQQHRPSHAKREC
jgi:cytochrome P450